jgi:hypothetical protein
MILHRIICDLVVVYLRDAVTAEQIGAVNAEPTAAVTV